MQHNPIPNVNGAGSAAPATPKTTEIAVILDRSGSMEAIANDAIGGFNASVASQRTVSSRTSAPSRATERQATAGVSREGGESHHVDQAHLTLVPSTTFTLRHISDLIAQEHAQGWQFGFLAANQDAIASASRLSIPAADARALAYG
jgi:hypothetical protein